MLKQLEENGRRTLSENGSNEEWMLSKHKGVQNTDGQWATVTLPQPRGWDTTTNDTTTRSAAETSFWRNSKHETHWLLLLHSDLGLFQAK